MKKLTLAVAALLGCTSAVKTDNLGDIFKYYESHTSPGCGCGNLGGGGGGFKSHGINYDYTCKA